MACSRTASRVRRTCRCARLPETYHARREPLYQHLSHGPGRQVLPGLPQNHGRDRSLGHHDRSPAHRGAGRPSPARSGQGRITAADIGAILTHAPHSLRRFPRFLAGPAIRSTSVRHFPVSPKQAGPVFFPSLFPLLSSSRWSFVPPVEFTVRHTACVTCATSASSYSREISLFV